MTDHVANRTGIREALRRELVGPAPAGRGIDTSREEIRFTDVNESFGPWRDLRSGEEILIRDSPTKRYGVGVLFPLRARIDEVLERPGEEEGDAGDAPAEPLEVEVDAAPGEAQEAATDDFDLSLANAYEPSSMGISFLAEIRPGSALVVEATGGRYSRRRVVVAPPEGAERRRTWWVRREVRIRATFPSDSLLSLVTRRVVASLHPREGELQTEAENAEDLDLRIEVFSRPNGPTQRLITVCLVNRTVGQETSGQSERCLFQSGFSATVHAPNGAGFILPYPGPRVEGDPDEESLALLYRWAQAFATGHGCSADWDVGSGGSRADRVRAVCLPFVETPMITPDVSRGDGSPIDAPMAALAGLVAGDDGFRVLDEIVALYESWIVERRAEISALPTQHRGAAELNLQRCESAAGRMRQGISYLREDPRALRAFQLADHAMLLQQLVTLNPPRAVSYDMTSLTFTFSEQARTPDVQHLPPNRGRWRAFQIAFVLASLRSTADGDAPDRRTVELIWFPTGGGKTEAYLGLAAFAMFKRRLDDPTDDGVHALMRYTLRLLTAQQFQRACGLICAMEHLRRLPGEGERLGVTPFSAGIWLGGETTPNTREQATEALSELERYRGARNAFLVARCPWCAAQFGRIDVQARRGTRGTGRALTAGYARHREPEWPAPTVVFKCPDTTCEFAQGLPIYVVDEDIYERRPTLVIGTIDKFAMLAWRPRAASLFGLSEDGRRTKSPPGLIIQDELHLIAGPLGSLAGLYETVIEELCTDRRQATQIPPKIVSSTATIRRYEDQIRALYARGDVALFPPPGLDARDSFFARHDTASAGRIYVGVHAVSLGSVQTEWVRAFAALLQAPMTLEGEARDPWWTMLVFFNSIREMGTAHTLFQSDVPDYLRVLWNREGISPDNRRYLSAARIFELTGGLPSDEVTGAIAALEVACTGSRGTPKDVCLASSIIEVGIDIPRLSLMVVAGQPKTTSQYIQVTGRVGRLRERPGLVVTMYSPSKPRDRSHFERFRAYHERLYAQVEPTSVTPFSPPALDRALHAVLVVYSRLTGGDDVARRPYPYPASVVERFWPLIQSRARFVDAAEEANLRRVYELRARQWEEWLRTRWDGDPQGEETPLLRTAGDYVSAEAARISWPTPTSMRNVDAECEAQITTLYIAPEQRDA